MRTDIKNRGLIIDCFAGGGGASGQTSGSGEFMHIPDEVVDEGLPFK